MSDSNFVSTEFVLNRRNASPLIKPSLTLKGWHEESQLGFHHPEEIECQRLHRIGKKGDRPRMIIARFLRYADRESVVKNAFKLKETDFKIFEDLPKELFCLRKKYLPAFYEAKKAGKKAVFSKSEPDKLFIDGKPIV